MNPETTKTLEPLKRVDGAPQIRLSTPHPDMQALPTEEGFPIYVPGQAAKDANGIPTPGLSVTLPVDVVKKYMKSLKQAHRSKSVKIDVVENGEATRVENFSELEDYLTAG